MATSSLDPTDILADPETDPMTRALAVRNQTRAQVGINASPWTQWLQAVQNAGGGKPVTLRGLETNQNPSTLWAPGQTSAVTGEDFPTPPTSLRLQADREIKERYPGYVEPPSLQGLKPKR